MRRTFAFISVAVLVALSAILSVVACSSDDGAVNPAPITNDGAPPADAVADDACTSASCTGDDHGDDDASFVIDGAFVGAGCVVDTDCDAGRCGYLTLAGCAATGICVTPDVPVVDGAPLQACGCDGQDVGYVTSGLTSAPASSLAPCADAGPMDGGVDAANDALGEEDASDAGDDAG